MKSSPASPLKSATEEIRVLQLLFRSTLKAYGAAMNEEIAALHTALNSEAEKTTLETDRLRDARDIIGLIRTLEVDPSKGRRKDLKKIEKTMGEVQEIVDAWKPKK